MAMKYASIFLVNVLLPCICLCQGSSCAAPINLTLDGVERTYATSSNTAGNVICNNNGNTPVTWFSFTTDATAQCPLFSIQAPGACEVALYTSCANNANQSASGMCFYDGEGLWAPAESFVLTANTTYYLRVKTANSGSIAMAGQFFSPDNNNCLGAHSIGSSPRTENNACNRPTTDVLHDQLCALTLENVAFYRYYVASTGVSLIDINSVTCDNVANNNSNGFQVGFFAGECGSLEFLNCAEVFGTANQVTTRSLPAGTKVTVAIDGIGGSNCQYTVTAFNAYGVLAEGFKNFSVWKKSSSNVIRWMVEANDALYYEVERSENGKDFRALSRLYKSQTSQYTFEDLSPSVENFYRIRQMKTNGQIQFSEIIQSRRENLTQLQIRLLTISNQNLDLKIESMTSKVFDYTISDFSGRVLIKGKWNCTQGTNKISKNISSLPMGKYFIGLYDGKSQFSRQFIKMN